MVKVSEGTFPLLRRPLGIHDADAGGIELFFKVAGQGTEILSRKRPGDRLDIIGPLGKGFTVSRRDEGEDGLSRRRRPGHRPALSSWPASSRRAGARPVVFYGGRRPGRHPAPRAGSRRPASNSSARPTTAASASPGFVTELVDRELAKDKPAIVYACGPDPMMKALAAITAKHGVPAEFSLESVMGCGIGACWGCVHRIRNESGDGWVKICEEGPVFPGERILWP